jgi:hypothetical protein
MDSPSSPPINGAIAALRRLSRSRPSAPTAAVEYCDLCRAALAAEHQHLIEPAQRQLACVCDACAILFGSAGETKYRRVPRDARLLTDLHLSDAQWESLLIPIQLAFFFHSSPAGKVVALYPSPAGPTESLLDLRAWSEIARANSALNRMEPDVEGLLVNRVGETREYFIAPIDECFKLVGLIRMHWRGFSGGALAWEEIGRFFDELRKLARVVREESYNASPENAPKQ